MLLYFVVVGVAVGTVGVTARAQSPDVPARASDVDGILDTRGEKDAARRRMAPAPAAAADNEDGEPGGPLRECERQKRQLSDHLVVLLRRGEAGTEARAPGQSDAGKGVLEVCRKALGRLERQKINLAQQVLRVKELLALAKDEIRGLRGSEKAAEADRDAIRGEMERIQLDLEDARGEKDRLIVILEKNGLRSNPKFEYFRGSNIDSFLSERKLPPQTKFPPLRPDQCGAALDWLFAQRNKAPAIDKKVWVRAEGGAWQLCTRGDDDRQEARLLPPGRWDEAHLVHFR